MNRAISLERSDSHILPVYQSADELVRGSRPNSPVYCLYPHVLSRDAQRFVQGFPGPSLYAVKANPSVHVVSRLAAAGVRHFDTASVKEIADTMAIVPDARCYYMAPVRMQGAAGIAYHDYGVRDFVVDCSAEIENVLRETGARDITLWVRHATKSGTSVLDLSRKFGATQDEAVDLLRQVERSGCAPAISFHVGSLCLSPDAYARAIETAAGIWRRSGVDIAALNTGGGFPTPYPSVDVPPIEAYFETIKDAIADQGFKTNIKLVCEPGRALSAECLSVVTRVIRRRGNVLFLNDGIYGSFCETVQLQPSIQFPTRVFGDDNGEPVERTGQGRAFHTFGPTCDSVDVLPWDPVLPDDIAEGDWIEFGMAGAYSVSTRTEFNGMKPDTFALIGSQDVLPPGVVL